MSIVRARRLSILNVSQNYFVRGGSDRMYFENERLLSASGHKVIPFAAASAHNRTSSWSRYFPAAADFDNPGPRDLIRYVYSTAASKALHRLLSDWQLDIAHLHIYYGKLTASILPTLRRFRIPVVQTLHEYKLICPVYSLVSNGQICEACEGSHYYRALPRRCNRGSLTRTALSVVESYVSRLVGCVDLVDHFIAVSDFLRSKMVEYGVPPEKVTTVRNFVDCSEVTPNSREGEYVLYFGRLESVKGVETLLEAIAPLKEVSLLVVGDGSLGDRLRRVVVERNLDHVEVLGFREGAELDEIIRSSICTVVPSEWYEPLATTVLESYRHSRPVIASRIGGLVEMVEDGNDGILIEPASPNSLTEAIRWMVEHRDKAVEMGINGRQKVETNFSPEHYLEQLLGVYERVLESASTSYSGA